MIEILEPCCCDECVFLVMEQMDKGANAYCKFYKNKGINPFKTSQKAGFCKVTRITVEEAE